MKERAGAIILALLISITFSSCEYISEEDTAQEAINPTTEAVNEENNIEESISATTAPTQLIEESITPAVKNDNTDIIPVILETPPFSYYISDRVKPDDKQPIQLTMISSTYNEITDDDIWFIDNNLIYNTYGVPNSYKNITGNQQDEKAKLREDLLRTSAFYDDSYIYDGYVSGFGDDYILNIYDWNSLELMYVLDFSNYCYTPEYVFDDFDYIQQIVNWAAIKDNILFVSHSHNTYAKSSNNMNGYITAIDLSDMTILWRTEPLVSNACNFELIDDVIISGYGFTDEPDFLYQIDTSSGKIIDKIPLKTAAEYIIRKDNVLYVRTYNMNYEFEISR
ncbi:MAG TPA: hypothetical protein GXZ21_02080 [Clostridiales bacterium]|nr:hypothetical protein [Clostridiales bacterium]